MTRKKGDLMMGDAPPVGWPLKGAPESPSQSRWGGRFVRSCVKGNMVPVLPAAVMVGVYAGNETRLATATRALRLVNDEIIS
jgi:hypothetical protein